MLFVERATRGGAVVRAHRRQRAGGGRDLRPARRHPAGHRAGRRPGWPSSPRRTSPPTSTTASTCWPAGRAARPATRRCGRSSQWSYDHARRRRTAPPRPPVGVPRRLRPGGRRGRSPGPTRPCGPTGPSPSWPTSSTVRSSRCTTTATTRYALLETIRCLRRPSVSSSWERRRRPGRRHLALGRRRSPARPTTSCAARTGAVGRPGSPPSGATCGRRSAGRSTGPAPSIGRELAARLARWWFVSGHYTEGRQFLVRALAGADDEPARIRARLQLGAGWCAYHLGDSDEAEAARHCRPRGRAGAADDAFLAAWARILLAGLAWSAGDGDRVRDLLAGAAEWTEDPAADRLGRPGRRAAQQRHVRGRRPRRGPPPRRAGRRLARAAPGRRTSPWRSSARPIRRWWPAIWTRRDAHRRGAGHRRRPPATGSPRRSPATSGPGCGRCGATPRRRRPRRHAAGRWAAPAGCASSTRLASVAEAAAALAAGRTDDAEDALGRAVAGGRAMGFVAFVPGWLADRACLAAHLGDEATGRGPHRRAEASGVATAGERLTAATVDSPRRPCCAWRRGDLAGAERLAREATASWHGAGARSTPPTASSCSARWPAHRGRWEDGVRLLARGGGRPRPPRLPGRRPVRRARRGGRRPSRRRRARAGDAARAPRWDGGRRDGARRGGRVRARRGSGGANDPTRAGRASPRPSARSSSW